MYFDILDKDHLGLCFSLSSRASSLLWLTHIMSILDNLISVSKEYKVGRRYTAYSALPALLRCLIRWSDPLNCAILHICMAFYPLPKETSYVIRVTKTMVNKKEQHFI